MVTRKNTCPLTFDPSSTRIFCHFHWNIYSILHHSSLKTIDCRNPGRSTTSEWHYSDKDYPPTHTHIWCLICILKIFDPYPHIRIHCIASYITIQLQAEILLEFLLNWALDVYFKTKMKAKTSLHNLHTFFLPLLIWVVPCGIAFMVRSNPPSLSCRIRDDDFVPWFSGMVSRRPSWFQVRNWSRTDRPSAAQSVGKTKKLLVALKNVTATGCDSEHENVTFPWNREQIKDKWVNLT